MGENFNLSWLEDLGVVYKNRLSAHSDHEFFVTDDNKKELVKNLDGTWKVRIWANPYEVPQEFFENGGYKENYIFGVEPAGFQNITVPGHLQLQGHGQIQYINTMYPWDGRDNLRPPFISKRENLTAVYLLDFTAEELWHVNPAQYVLRFEGAESAIAVWLNGQFVGYAEDSFTPSEFDVTPFLKEKNRLTVINFLRSKSSWIEDQDMWRFSGLFRSVYLIAKPKTHVQDVFVHARADGTFRADFSIWGENPATIDVVLKDKQSVPVFEQELAGDVRNVEYVLEKAHLWSGEDPYLYELDLVCKDDKERIIETARTKVGFRTFAMEDGVMKLNGKRIIFRGVNRHEFNMNRGRAITKDDMLRDIKILKTNNINAVRTCHYPNQSLWYQLCDENGIYLIDETNMESHGSWQKLGVCEPSWNVPGSDPAWAEVVLDRAKSMLERDKNHPSVLIWSCGNESYAGEDIRNMTRYFHETDPDRLVHYEGVFWNRDFDDISDMESRMYAKPQDIVEYLENDPKKPYISCEYMHAMGNSVGGMKLYTDLEDKYEKYQGGFIWDYIDQALMQEMPDHTRHLAYGGDFDERATDYCFCTDGIVYADRTISPKMAEVKQLYAPVSITIEEHGFIVENRNLFSDLSGYIFKAKLSHEGKTVRSVEYTLECEPGKCVRAGLPKIEEKDIGPGEFVITVSCRLKKAGLCGEMGHEVAFTQKVLDFWDETAQIPSRATDEQKAKFEVIEGDINLGVRGVTPLNVPFFMMFSKSEGGIISYVYDGTEYVTRTPKLTFFRAYTDNEKGRGAEYEDAGWLAATRGNHYVPGSFKYEYVDDGVKIMTSHASKYPEKFVCKIIYTVKNDGTMLVEAEYPGITAEESMPQFGMEWKLKKDLTNVRYYGYGPEENYIDRMNGVRLDLFETTPEKSLAPYLIPQECGNHEGVRFLELYHEDVKAKAKAAQLFGLANAGTVRTGIRIEAHPELISFSCLPVSALSLEEAMHGYELPEKSYTWLRLTSCTQGVGGDDSWGAPLQDAFKLSAKESRKLSFRIVPLKAKN